MFNGKIAYEEGLDAINNAHEDNYGEMLDLYPVSDHRAAQAAKSKMERTIEKCRKSIKTHSIKSRPKVDKKRANDPAYRQWLKSEEFNNQLGEAWMLLGQAEFHQGDFIGSVGTFNYIQKHYELDKDIIARCKIWTARAYAEMGWLYEAEDMLAKVNADDLKRKNASLYAAASADIRIKLEQYHEAIPFVKLALPDEKRNIYRPRFFYVLGQLYEHEGKRAEAYYAYKKCVGLYPPIKMDFNARIRMAMLGDNPKKAVKQLTSLAKNYKYRDQLDVIYGAIGDVYMQQRDTAKAIENYQLAIDKSTQNGLDKAAALIKAADLYYAMQDYIHAEPCYTEAATILSNESAQYARVKLRSEVLGDLAVQYNTVVLQDSLQHLATLTEEEQYKVVEQIIEELRRQEAEDSIRAAQEERESRDGPTSVNTSRMIGGGGQSTEWYFYNPQLLRNGKQQFRQTWGNRALEDDWRRKSKSGQAIAWANNEDSDEEDMPTDSLAMAMDSTAGAAAAPETDPYKPEYYLQQIPKTAEQLAASDTAIANALYEMIFIYRDRLYDTLQSNRTRDELETRYPADGRIADLRRREALMQDEAYIAEMRHMLVAQDSLYELTYTAYKQGEFRAVKQETQQFREAYPESELMPNFLFLNAVAKARTEGQDSFIVALKEIVTRYPNHELTTMSKDMLAMLGQGMESQQGGAVSNLESKRQEQADTEQQRTEADSISFSTERNEPAYVLLLLRTDETGLNNLLYEVALFNFSRFLIKDFELTTLPVYAGASALRIGGLENMDEAEWYSTMLDQSAELERLCQEMNIKRIIITDTNYKLIGAGKTITDYETFIRSADNIDARTQR